MKYGGYIRIRKKYTEHSDIRKSMRRQGKSISRRCDVSLVGAPDEVDAILGASTGSHCAWRLRPRKKALYVAYPDGISSKFGSLTLRLSSKGYPHLDVHLRNLPSDVHSRGVSMPTKYYWFASSVAEGMPRGLCIDRSRLPSPKVDLDPSFKTKAPVGQCAHMATSKSPLPLHDALPDAREICSVSNRSPANTAF